MAGAAWSQSILLLIVWTHGCVGLHFWLRLKRWYPRARPWLATLAILVPTLALTGWINAARMVVVTVGEKVRFEPGQQAQLAEWAEMIRWAALAILIAVLAVQVGRWLHDLTRPKVTLFYRDGKTVLTRPGPTLLEISRAHNIPHTSVCGGRARCSTCRTLILSGEHSLPPPTNAERAALEKAGARENVRLACQIRPVRDLEVQPLLGAGRSKGTQTTQDDRFRWGVEQQVAVMFIDLRGFTSVAEHKLPFDTVFILNRYLDGATGVIRAAGGSIDKVMGDGIMALFGVESGGAEGARQALHAIVDLAAELEHINADLAAQLDAPLRLGVGVHTGPAILGRIGLHGHAGPQANITALGDTVNVASRLEGATKELSAFAVVSQDTVEAAGLGRLATAPGVGIHAFAVRGRAEPLSVLAFPTRRSSRPASTRWRLPAVPFRTTPRAAAQVKRAPMARLIRQGTRILEKGSEDGLDLPVTGRTICAEHRHQRKSQP
ncbi:adenylate/guanylate cyclase domain-containing protein [Breoghania sp. L-A4]|uniref:adenylate/guanylate cyclase domain-containing protein n=1 Tax=Breoghania sp. L-A4 TaxID=2304600 RepID=UPI0013C342BA|nr:adenylate/guanylate cyclase domain-containing protein [Breoghania sp. L-A4]